MKRTLTCAAAEQGCTCGGDVAAHNVWLFNKRQERIAASPHSECPKCGRSGLTAVIDRWGHCFDCQREADSIKYGVKL